MLGTRPGGMTPQAKLCNPFRFAWHRLVARSSHQLCVHAMAPSLFLQPGGVDTTWMRIYCSLRAGFHAEAAQVRAGALPTRAPGVLSLQWSVHPRRHGHAFAFRHPLAYRHCHTEHGPMACPLQVAKSTREVTTPRAGGSDLAAQLAAWAEGGGRPLGGEAGAHLAAECDRLLRDKAARQRHPFSAQRAMVHALLSGYNRGAEQVVKVRVVWKGRSRRLGAEAVDWGAISVAGAGPGCLPSLAGLLLYGFIKS